MSFSSWSPAKCLKYKDISKAVSSKLALRIDAKLKPLSRGCMAVGTDCQTHKNEVAGSSVEVECFSSCNCMQNLLALCKLRHIHVCILLVCSLIIFTWPCSCWGLRVMPVAQMTVKHSHCNKREENKVKFSKETCSKQIVTFLAYRQPVVTEVILESFLSILNLYFT